MKTVVKLMVIVGLFMTGKQWVQAAQGSGNKVIRYSEYGAKGDGVTDDFDAIIKAHEAANKAGLKVIADAGATYYIGGADKTAIIQTDVDWGDAKFIFDDRNIANRNTNIFNVSSKLPATEITTVKTLKKNQQKLDLSLPYSSFVVANNNTVRNYIRWGPDANKGYPQTDVFVVDRNGNVDMKAPIIWDFATITSMTAYPVDPEILTVKGGRFTTIAHQMQPPQRYTSRGISITRSNVVIDGVYHTVTEELDLTVPYNGFLSVSNCTNVTIQNCLLTARKISNMGTYELTVNRSTNVSFINCTQMNDIHSTGTWGIMGTNYSKNLYLDSCHFSRFDAHMGVANATIRNSSFGRQGLNIIGCGTFLIENSKVNAYTFINMRSDYGSTWEGEVIIRNCQFLPRNGLQADAVIIGGENQGQHDFGYQCYMPRKITIDGLVINDIHTPPNYTGPKIFANFNRDYTNANYVEKFPYIITEEVSIRNLTIKSGKPLNVSANPYMFRNVKIVNSE